MNYENNNDHTNTLFCTNCGSKLEPDSKFCNLCGAPVSYDDVPLIFPAQPPVANNNPIVVTPATQKKRKKIYIVVPIVVILSIVLVLGGLFTILTSTHVICIEHKWAKATCTKPEMCIYCNKTEGEEKGHKWKSATCTSPKICSECSKKEGDPKGHDYSWVLTSSPTLTANGKEQQKCSICNDMGISRTISKKYPEIYGNSFNFKDNEFITWLECESSAQIGSLQELEDNNTAYIIYYKDDIGLISFNHGYGDANSNICAILIYFKNSKISLELSSFIGNKINRNFNPSDARNILTSGDVYIKGSITAVMVPYNELSFVLLAPTDYFLEMPDF